VKTIRVFDSTSIHLHVVLMHDNNCNYIWLGVNLWHYQKHYVVGCDTMKPGRHKSFRETCCFHLQGKRTKHLQTRRHRQLVSVKCQWLSFSMHGVTSHFKTVDSPAKWVQIFQWPEQTGNMWQCYIPEACNLKMCVFWSVPFYIPPGKHYSYLCILTFNFKMEAAALLQLHTGHLLVLGERNF
jgi:hypothetical protein